MDRLHVTCATPTGGGSDEPPHVRLAVAAARPARAGARQRWGLSAAPVESAEQAEGRVRLHVGDGTTRAACFTRPKDYYKRFCVDANRHASEMADYVNYLFEVSSINLQAVPKAAPFGHAYDPGREDEFVHVIRNLRQQHQASVLMIVRADPWAGVNGACYRNDEKCWASWRRSGFRPLKQTVAHEIGHWLGIHHSADEGFPGMPRYAAGWGTWAFVDVMHPAGTRGNGTIVRDTYSDHERMCNSWMRCGDYHDGSAARYLRDTYGRWKR